MVVAPGGYDGNAENQLVTPFDELDVMKLLAFEIHTVIPDAPLVSVIEDVLGFIVLTVLAVGDVNNPPPTELTYVAAVVGRVGSPHIGDGLGDGVRDMDAVRVEVVEMDALKDRDRVVDAVSDIDGVGDAVTRVYEDEVATMLYRGAPREESVCGRMKPGRIDTVISVGASGIVVQYRNASAPFERKSIEDGVHPSEEIRDMFAEEVFTNSEKASLSRVVPPTKNWGAPVCCTSAYMVGTVITST